MADTIFGTASDDTIIGTAAGEIFRTLTGDDTVEGGAGDDIIITNEGSDTLLGGAGDDQLYGCEDDDILDGGAGADIVNGGTGDDLLIFRASENMSARADYYDGFADRDALRLILTQAEFNAAQGEITAFQSYIQANGSDIAAPFFYFSSLNLFARRIDTLQVVVDGVFVIGEPEPELVLEDDEDSLTVGEPVTGTVASNDSVPDGSVFSLVEPVEEGTLTFNEDGSYSFDPGDDFDDLGEEQTRTVIFTYQVTTPSGATSQAQASITVTGVNDTPVAAEDRTITVNESDDAFLLNVLQGATDVDGDTLIIGDVRVTSGNSEAIFVSTGSVEFDPSVFANILEEGDTATVVVEADIEDGNGGVDTRTFTINVNGETPVVLSAQDDTADVDVGAPLEGSVATNDTLPDGSFFSVESDVERGTLTLNEDGSFTYDPGEDFDDLIIGTNLAPETDTETFTYRVTAPDGQTATAQVTLTIEATNFLPTGGGGSSFGEGNPGFQAIDLALINGLTTDGTDRDGDPITFSNAVLLDEDGDPITVPNQSFLDGSTFRFDRTAFQFLNQGDMRAFTLQYEISDGIATRTVTTALTLTGTEDSPVAGAVIERVIQESADSLDLTALVLANVTDADEGDNDLLSIVSIGGGNTSTPPVGAVLDNGTLTFDPSSYAANLDEGESVTVRIAVRVDDDFSAGNSNTSAIQLVDITIVGETPPNSDPTVSGPLVGSFTEDEPGDSGVITFDLVANATDPDGDALTVENLMAIYSGDDTVDVDLVDNRFFTITAQQAVFQTLAAGETETISLTYDIIDGNGGRVAQTGTLTLIGVNDAPFAGDDLSFTLMESDDEFVIDGLTGQDGVAAAFDIDGDELSYDGYTLISGDDAGFISSLDFIAVDPSAYSDLNDGETEVIVIEIEVDDGNGGTDTRQATITIVGEDNVVSNPPGNFTDGSTLFQTNAVEGGAPVQSLRLSDVVTTPDGGDVVFDSYVSTPFAGLSYDAGTQIFTFDPTNTAYDDLRAGETLELLTVIQVRDDQGGFSDAELRLEIVGTNDAPTVGVGLTLDVSEDLSVESLELLTGASDADNGDTLFISNIRGTAGFGGAFQIDELSGLLIVDTVSPGLDFIAEGEVESIVITYDVTDAYGATVEQTATINVTGSNDAPEIESELTFTIQADTTGMTANDDNLRREVDLFAAIFDPEGEVFSIVDFSVSTVDDAAYSVDLDTGILTIDYNSFEATEFGEFSIDYTVEDESGAESFFNASVTVIQTTANVAPVSDGTLEIDLVAGNVASPVTLFDNLTDQDGDMLFIEQVVGLNDFFFDFETGEFFPDLILDGLAEGVSFDLFFTMLVGDGRGGSVEQDVVITFNGTNNDISAGLLQTEYTFTEDDDVVLIDLVAGIEDDNGDVITVTNVSGTGGTLLNDRFLRIDTATFSQLTNGETEVLTFDVSVTDGFDDPDTYQLTVNINGVDDLPVLVRDARFFDNDVDGYQTSGGQQNFVIRPGEVFDDGDNSNPLDGPDDRFTSVMVASGTAVPVSINADGEIEIDPSSIGFLLEAGERIDITFDWEGVTGDGNLISGQFDYRIEGTTTTGVNQSGGKGKITYREPGRTADDVAHLMSENYVPESESTRSITNNVEVSLPKNSSDKILLDDVSDFPLLRREIAQELHDVLPEKFNPSWVDELYNMEFWSAPFEIDYGI